MKDSLGFEDTEALIKALPATWIPALLLLLVRTAYEKKVFVPGRATVFIRDNVPGEECEPLLLEAGAKIEDLENRLENALGERDKYRASLNTRTVS